MAKKTKAAPRKSARAAAAQQEGNQVEMAALVEYLANNAVSELVIVEVTKGTYRLDALLTWKPGRSQLVAARGRVRMFRSVDTLIRLFKQMGVGRTSIRMELKT